MSHCGRRPSFGRERRLAAMPRLCSGAVKRREAGPGWRRRYVDSLGRSRSLPSRVLSRSSANSVVVLAALCHPAVAGHCCRPRPFSANVWPVLAETARRRAGMSFDSGAGGGRGVVPVERDLGRHPQLWIPGLQFPFSAVIFVLAVVGYAGISFWVGHGMASRAGPLVAVLLGAVLITILQPIPIVGWLAGFIFFMMALGKCRCLADLALRLIG